MSPCTLLNHKQRIKQFLTEKNDITFHTNTFEIRELTCTFAHRRNHICMKLTSDRRPRAIPDDMAVI